MQTALNLYISSGFTSTTPRNNDFDIIKTDDNDDDGDDDDSNDDFDDNDDNYDDDVG